MILSFFFVAAVSLASTANVVAANDENNALGRPKRSFVNVLDNATIDVMKECVDTNGEYTEIIVRSPPHNLVPVHFHTAYEEYAESIQGTVYFKVGDSQDPIALTPGKSLSVVGNVSHVWWTEDEPVIFRARSRPCFDGFHEGLEIAAGARAATKEQIAALNPGPLTKIRTAAVLGQMMATELVGGYLVTGIGYVYRQLASTATSQTLLQELRRQFLPHLQDNGDDGGVDMKTQREEL